MKRRMLQLLIGGILILGAMALSGCSSFYVVDRTMTIQEIYAMAAADVDPDVMIAQIDATHTQFALTTEDLIRLKKENVPDDVVEYMIETGIGPDRFGWEDIYDPIVGYPYDYYYPFYRNYYSSPYSSMYYSGGPYRMYRPYVVTREPGLVGRFYQYSAPPVYESRSTRRPPNNGGTNGSEPNSNEGQRRRPDTGSDND